MNRQPVKSSSIRSIGYDAATQILEVEFHRRGTFQYIGVPEFVYRALMLAPSKGAFFNDRVSNRYKHIETRR
jgi:hypothetical protein